jgi:hypothetical protein
LSNGSINDFGLAGFNNFVNYSLNDAYIGLEYKFKIGRWINKPGIYLHQFDLKTTQENKNITVSKTLLQPHFNSEFEFNQSESLVFNYKLSNDFPEVHELANRFRLQNLNSVYRGNAVLENEQFHAATLRYSKMNSYRGIMMFATASFNKKIKTLRDEINFVGINSFSTPILTNNPETSLRFSGNFSKKIYRFKMALKSSWSQFEYFQKVNNLETLNTRVNSEVGFEIKTVYNKWPDISIGYTKSIGVFKNMTESKFSSNAINANIEHSFLKNWIFKTDYDYLQNTNDNGQKNSFGIANASLRWQKKNSAFGFQLTANNIFDTTSKNNFTFSDFMISEQQTFVLPRVLLLSVQYKL